MTEPQEVLLVALPDIEVPEGWNARSGAWHENPADASSDDGGYEGLKASMTAKGRNDTPVLLRPHYEGVPPKVKTRYILVDGFRRMRVAKELGWTHVRAIVEVMTEAEARGRNIQAQTSHERLKTADLAWAIADWKRLDPKITDPEIAARAGISEMYVSVLRRVMQHGDPKMTAAWRASPVHVDPYQLLQISKLPHEQHWKQWKTLVLGKETQPHGNTRGRVHLRLETRVRELGKTIGELDRLGIVTAHHARDWSTALRLLSKRTFTFEQATQLAAVMLEGYHEGLLQKEGKP